MKKLIFIFCLLLPTSLFAQGTYDGAIDTANPMHEYTFHAEQGQQVKVILTSEDFDTFLTLVSPDGSESENDDWAESTNESRLDLLATTAGEWVVQVKSYEDGAGGNYKLDIILGKVGDVQSFGGKLDVTDTQSGKGEYYESRSVDLKEGDRVTFDLSSDDFDTYLVVVSPSGKYYSNDDKGEEDGTDSYLDIFVTEAGTWQTLSTSLEAEMTGKYSLRVTVFEGAGSAERRTGSLGEGDNRMVRGEYFDEHHIDLEEGDMASFTMIASDFDCFLVVISPSGQRWTNDDFNGDIHTSQLETQVDVSGKWKVLTTSLNADDEGDYQLIVVRN